MRNTCKSVLSRLLLGAASGVLAVASISESNAGTLAFSSLTISNFQIFKSDGTQFDVSEFDLLRFGNFTKAEAELDGVGAVGADASDVGLQCVGACGGVGQNDFGLQGGPLGHFSRADAVLAGAGVSGLSVPDSVTSSSVAEIQLNAPGAATSGSNTGAGSSFSFMLDNDDSLTFAFDAEAVLRTMLGQDDVMAFAGLAWGVSLWDATGNLVFNFAPTGAGGGDPCSLNRGIAVLDDGPGGASYACTGSFAATSPVLSAGETYTLSIHHESAARGEGRAGPGPAPVPEPAALGVLGAGLLGLAAARRRMRRLPRR